MFTFCPLLDNNKIKFLNGALFDRLSNLMVVRLLINECIDEDFKEPNAIERMSGVIDVKCGFEENVEP